MSPSHDSDGEPLLEDNGESRTTGYSKRPSLCLWILQFLILISSAGLFFSGLARRAPTDKECAAQLSAYSPAIEAVEYETIKLRGALHDQNPFRGPPSPAIDAAWQEILNMSEIKLDPRDMPLLKKPLTQAKYPDDEGGWYIGILEVTHQLHCVNLIRQYTYLDYYSRPENRPVAFGDKNQTLRLHIDHCIDMLRQVVQCNGDVGIVTSSWVKGHDGPYPDFSVWHKCRRWQPLMDYTVKHKVDHDLVMADDAFVLPHPPCQNATPEEVCP
ncbi:hypothetical protein VTN00DRAFT_4048 [Thermoascus crustaceus]|uniref:uncharacterized protein n=1 Tax=Thermoascus crustaceus TaxID=5088 RepID=UPI0037447061